MGTDRILAPKGSSGCRVQQEQPGRVPLCSGAPSKGLVLSLTVTVLHRRHAVWDCNGEEFPKERLVPLAFPLATPSPCKGICYLRPRIKDNFVLEREGVQDCYGVCFFYQASRLVLLTQSIPEDKVLFSDFLELSHRVQFLMSAGKFVSQQSVVCTSLSTFANLFNLLELFLCTQDTVFKF